MGLAVMMVALAVAVVAALAMWDRERRKLEDARQLLDMETEAARQAASDAAMEDMTVKTEVYWTLSGVAQRLKEILK